MIWFYATATKGTSYACLLGVFKCDRIDSTKQPVPSVKDILYILNQTYNATRKRLDFCMNMWCRTIYLRYTDTKKKHPFYKVLYLLNQ